MTHPLAQFRTDKGWSKATLAVKARTTRQTIHRIENGDQVPSLALVRRLVDIADHKLSADDFLPASTEVAA